MARRSAIAGRACFLSLLLIALTACKEETPKVSEVRPVRTVVVDLRPFEDIREVVGEIRPRQEIELGFRVSGKLAVREVHAGDTVKKGTTLARLEDQDYQNKLHSSEADVTAANAVLTEARSTKDRELKLLGSGATTRANYDEATKNLSSAEAKFDSAKIALAMATDQLAYTQLVADFDGIVTNVGAEAGQVVSTGQMIVKLSPPSEKDAVFSIAESALQQHAPEDRPKVTVRLLSNPDVSAQGIVREVSPIADPATRTFQVKVGLEDPPDQMLFGSSVVGQLKTAEIPVVALPGSAIFDKAGQPAVWIYDAASQLVALKLVTIDRYEAERVIIAEGLVKGDIVVTAGVNRLREGQKVRLAEEP